MKVVMVVVELWWWWWCCCCIGGGGSCDIGVHRVGRCTPVVVALKVVMVVVAVPDGEAAW